MVIGCIIFDQIINCLLDEEVWLVIPLEQKDNFSLSCVVSDELQLSLWISSLMDQLDSVVSSKVALDIDKLIFLKVRSHLHLAEFNLLVDMSLLVDGEVSLLFFGFLSLLLSSHIFFFDFFQLINFVLVFLIIDYQFIIMKLYFGAHVSFDPMTLRDNTSVLGVKPDLNALVYGEATINDAVAVV